MNYPTASLKLSLWQLLFGCWVISILAGCKNDLPEPIHIATKNIPDQISYNFHVRPILSENCFSCHGPDEAKRKSGIRLDIPQEAYRTSPSTGQRPIVADKIHRSELVHRILTADQELLMPPPESKLTLSDREKAILLRWIEQGAPYEKHWAFQKPEKPELPEVKQKAWPKNEIDFFILHRMEQVGFTPSPPAQPEQLIRRLSFDLTGLPPTLPIVDQYLTHPDEYAKWVNQFLEKPAYGERMAAYWMEVARYADSDGYLDDKHRDFSPYRDWVIKAFNENMSYEQFVTWQLAGDLLDQPTQEQILATAFNRLHKKNSEAGIVLEEYRTEYVADRTNTFGKAFLGMTMECARCHSHKYDPISQEDYYSLFAFFNSTDEIGHAVYGPDITPAPALLLTDQEVQLQLNAIQTALKKEEQQLAEAVKKYAPQSSSISPSEVLEDLKPALKAYYPFDTILIDKNGKHSSPNLVHEQTPAKVQEPLQVKGISGSALLNSDYSTTHLGEKVAWFERTQAFSVDCWIKPERVYEEASIFLHAEDWRLGNKGYGLFLFDNQLRFFMAHAYPQNAIEVQTIDRLSPNGWTQVTITYDGSSKAEGISIFINGQRAQTETRVNNLYKGITYTPNIHTYGFHGFQLGKRDGVKPMDGGAIDELRIFDKELSALEVHTLHHIPNTLNTVFTSTQSTSTDQLISSHHQQQYEQEQYTHFNIQAHRDSLNQLMNRIPEIMVMGDLPTPRSTFVLERGAYDAPSQEVFPATPNSILAFAKSFPSNRLGLAQWLFHKDNPLTARVIVNQIWQLHFGEGLVRTPEDFGNQGALPTHPALLDWLAVWFRESGWNIKALHQLIVNSATYQQSSKWTEEHLKKDPENIYLSRMNRFRLPAEMIRDNALSISGLLAQKIGGSSVYPYQPEGLWDEISNKSWRYPYLQEDGEGLYRRSLYTIWKRTAAPPAMLIFDANDRTICRVKRKTTNTPLQALVLLNDPHYVESARVLSEKIMNQNLSITKQLHLAARYTIGRTLNAQELDKMTQLYNKQVNYFKADSNKLKDFLNVGYQRVKEDTPKLECAALAIVINTLMNTDEGSTRV